MLFALCKAGDTIMTAEVSRLSRSTQQLCELIRSRHVRFLALQPSIAVKQKQDAGPSPSHRS